MNEFWIDGLIDHDKLEEQYDVILKRGDRNERQMAIALARYAEARVYNAAERRIDELKKGGMPSQVREAIKSALILHRHIGKTQLMWSDKNADLIAIDKALAWLEERRKAVEDANQP